MGVVDPRHVISPAESWPRGRGPRDFNIFSLSFLDVISCGFGAVVLLVLVSNTADAAFELEADATARAGVAWRREQGSRRGPRGP